MTIAAMGCQRAITKQITDAGGDSVLALKANHGTLHAEVIDSFAMAREHTGAHKTVEKGHGRLEIRVCRTINDPEMIAWAGLCSIAMVEATRHLTGMDTPTTQVRCYVSSLPGNAAQIARAVRSHWGIEHSLHWVLDMAFREVECRVRTGHSAQNLAMLRKLALNLIRQDKTHTRGVNTMRMKAAWDTTYLLHLLAAV